MRWLDNNSIRLSEKSLNYVWEKQKIIQENIANKTTPGYKAKYLSFEEELRNNLQRITNGDSYKSSQIENAIDKTKIRVNESTEESVRLDGNNVNIDVENMELARAQLQFQYLTRQISDDFSRLRTVIDGR